ncbi:LysR family transcriptional regulator [Salinarimonas ramus]|uniref:LysR family transcriptional regulator n=1 Tax=Salinarimonas ramus TaxID=690164 RepID=A0A917QCX4_9HYPH|nr:LysR family transcriptional regulator [Salinarimonas ramus]GGK44635.1 LysR family transcriptional regulator [Salinarimonas ramus]
MFDIRDAEVVREVVRCGGFRAAATRLNLTQSAISARVSALEERLSITIFDRKRRGARLTPQGRAFLEQAGRLVTLRDAIAESFAPDAGFVGTLRIGVAETIVHTWLAGMLTRVRDALPRIRIELSVETSPILARQLGEDAIDVAVLMEPLAPEGAVATPLYTCRLDWFAAPALALPAEPLDTSALAAQPIVTFARGTIPYAELERRLPGDGLAPPLLHACASLSTTLHLARDGFGIGLLPAPMAAADLARGTLRRVETTGEARMSDLAFAFAHMPRRSESVMQALLAAARAAIADFVHDRSERS